MIDLNDLKSKAESVLFSAGRSLTFDELMRLCRETNGQRLLDALGELRDDLDAKKSGIMLVEDNGNFKLAVRDKYVPVVRQVVKKAELTKGLLETLAFVAYKAPVLQRDVTRVRTNKAYDHLAQLEGGGYIIREKKGRTKLIKLTQKFYAYFDAAPGRLHERLNAAVPRLGDLEIYPTTPLVNPRTPSQPEGEHLGVLEVYKSAENSVPKKEQVSKPTEVSRVSAPLSQEQMLKPAEILGQEGSVENMPVPPFASLPVLQSEAMLAPPVVSAEIRSGDDTERTTAAQELETNMDGPQETTANEESAKQPCESETEQCSQEIEKRGNLQEQKRVESKSEGETGLFASGIPPSVQERVDARVNEIVKGEKKESDNPFEEQ